MIDNVYDSEKGVVGIRLEFAIRQLTLLPTPSNT